MLISGTPGSGKTSIAAHIINAGCARGERCLYFPFEESQSQIIRNMHSIGLDLGRWVGEERLRLHPARPHLRGLETHLATMHKQIAGFRPSIVAVDPISTFTDIGSVADAKAMLTRLVDFLKAQGITAILTTLTSGTDDPERTEVGISSLMDTWLLLRNLESNGERNRGLYILKSCGMSHSNQIREFILSNHGLVLRDAYIGTSGVLTGTARTIQEARDRAEELLRRNEIARKQRALERKRMAMEEQIVSLRKAFDAEASELAGLIFESQNADAVGDTPRQLVTGKSGNGRRYSRKGTGHGLLRHRQGRGHGRPRQSRAEAR
jgi:circadian clock protein KaiC